MKIKTILGILIGIAIIAVGIVVSSYTHPLVAYAFFVVAGAISGAFVRDNEIKSFLTGISAGFVGSVIFITGNVFNIVALGSYYQALLLSVQLLIPNFSTFSSKPLSYIIIVLIFTLFSGVGGAFATNFVKSQRIETPAKLPKIKKEQILKNSETETRKEIWEMDIRDLELMKQDLYTTLARNGAEMGFNHEFLNFIAGKYRNKEIMKEQYDMLKIEKENIISELQKKIETTNLKISELVFLLEYKTKKIQEEEQRRKEEEENKRNYSASLKYDNWSSSELFYSLCNVCNTPLVLDFKTESWYCDTCNKKIENPIVKIAKSTDFPAAHKSAVQKTIRIMENKINEDYKNKKFGRKKYLNLKENATEMKDKLLRS